MSALVEWDEYLAAGGARYEPGDVVLMGAALAEELRSTHALVRSLIAGIYGCDLTDDADEALTRLTEVVASLS